MNRIITKTLFNKPIAINVSQLRFKINPTTTRAEFITGKSAVGSPAGYQPIRVDLEKGKTYAWCACGASKKQPYCDGSHKAKNATLKPDEPQFGSLRFTAEDHKTSFLCMCKQSSNRPFCDGTHETLKKK